MLQKRSFLPKKKPGCPKVFRTIIVILPR
jgi:hypothetical protein